MRFSMLTLVAVVKDVQAAVYIQVKGLRHTVSLRDMLV